MQEQNRPQQPIIEFYADAKHDAFASEQEGRPIFVDIEMIRIRYPADRQRTLVRPAHAEVEKVRGKVVTYAMKHNEEYKRFKAGLAPVVNGLPLTEVPFLTEAQRRMLRALDVYTAEQLAALEGNSLKNIGMGGRELKDKAKAYLDNAAGTADVVRQAAEIARLSAEVERLRTLSPPPVEDEGEYAGVETSALKDMIEERSGHRPRGNPSRKTLIEELRSFQDAA